MMVAEEGKKKAKQGAMATLLQTRNWFLNAGLTLVIYGVVWYYLARYSSVRMGPVEETPLGYFLLHVIHVLPLLALTMVVLGLFERKQRAEQERERKRKRYEATMEISRLRREETGGRGGKPPS
jgi:hypothetical protein